MATESLINQISNLQLENSYLYNTLKAEREIYTKAKNEYEWAIFHKNQADIAVTNTNKNIEVRNKLIQELNEEIIKLQSELENSNKIVIDLTNQNAELLNKLNS